MATPVLEAVKISKTFGSLRALEDVSLTVHSGEVVGLVGDNGAGKSTLVNILSGSLAPTSGEILVDGKPVSFHNASDARAAGIETVYQDLALALNRSIAANVFLGREPLRSGPLRLLWWVDRHAMEAKTAAELDRLGVNLGGSLSQRCGELSGGQRQAVAVARAAAWGSRVVMMDEPTAALGVEQQARVLELVRQVRDRGIPVVYISHNMQQVHEVCDRVLVLLRGKLIADLKTAEVTPEDIVMWITGAALARA